MCSPNQFWTINGFTLFPIVLACIGFLNPGFCSAQSPAEKIPANHRVYLPTGDGPFPTIVAIPGCSGVSLDSPSSDAGRPGDQGDRLFRRHYPRMAERLSQRGFAVVLIDYLSAEGVANTCGGEISYERVGEYVDASLTFARNLPTTDSDRLFVVGWSHGGAGVISWLETVGTDHPQVTGAIAVYPGCTSLGPWATTLPVLVLLGGADDIALPQECRRIQGQLPETADARFREYPEGRHGFDLTEGPEVLELGGGMTLGRNDKVATAAWSEIFGFLEDLNAGPAVAHLPEFVPETRGPTFEVQHGWPVLPEGMMLGFVSGVDIDSHGHVFSLHSYTEWQEPFRTELESAPAVLVWDAKTGHLVDDWGSDFFRMPHGLSIDSDDNVWVTDVAHNQVFKFTHDGELQLVLGVNGVQGSDPLHFAQPTDVAFGPDGSVYVSDGYVNARVVSFTADGLYQFEWGKQGVDNAGFNVPHDLAVDSQGRVFVADRENDRIQVFEPDGTFVKEWRSGGEWRPYGIDIDWDRGYVFVADGGIQPYRLPYRSRVLVLDSTGAVIQHVGRFGNQDGQFIMGHDIALDQEGNIFVADVIGRRLQRFNRRGSEQNVPPDR